MLQSKLTGNKLLFLFFNSGEKKMKKSPIDQTKPDQPLKKNGAEEISPFIEAFRMLSHITTAIILMLICGGIGYAVDHYLGIKGVTLIGFLGGGTLALRHLIAATSR